MTCYAYKDSTCYETFEQHVKDVIECLLNRWELHGLAKKLTRLLGVDEKLVKDLIVLAGLFHDFGKLSKDLQEKCREHECTSFRHHYVVSAGFTLTVAYEAGILSVDTIEKKCRQLFGNPKITTLDEGDLFITLVLLPVLLHHYAQIVERSLIKPEIFECMYVDHVCKNVFLELLDWVRNYVETRLAMKIVDAARSILLKGDVVDISLVPNERSYLLNYRPSFVKALAEAAVGLLNLCDGRVAYTNRRLRGVDRG